jgi:hypothetical protein
VGGGRREEVGADAARRRSYQKRVNCALGSTGFGGRAANNKRLPGPKESGLTTIVAGDRPRQCAEVEPGPATRGGSEIARGLHTGDYLSVSRSRRRLMGEKSIGRLFESPP